MNQLADRTDFIIRFSFDRKEWRFPVTIEKISEAIEHITVKGVSRDFVFRSNRLFFRNRNLQHRRYEMKLITGKTWNMAFLEKLQDVIKDQIRFLENHDPNYIHPKNADNGKDYDPGKM